MGIIQSSINQAIGTAGVVARMSPGYEAKQQSYQLKKEESTARQRLKLAHELPKGKAHASEKRDIESKALADISKLSQERFEVAPTKENLNDLVKAKQSVRQYEAKEARRVKSNERARANALMKKIQKGDTKALHEALKRGDLNVATKK